MTVSTTTSSITYLGNDSTTVFSFPFIGVNYSDIEVLYTNSNGDTSTLSPSAYTLAINAVPVGGLWGIGGTVTYPIGGSPVPITVGTSITINRIVPYTQTVSISNQGNFYPQAVEQALDLLEMQIQQIDNLSVYAIRTPITDGTPPDELPVAADRANGYLGFDNTGQPVIFTAAPAIVEIVTATPRVVETTGTATINPEYSDSFGGIAIYQSSTPVTTVQLPSSYGPYPIFDGSLNAATYPITVLPPSGLTILGQDEYVLYTDGASAVFYNDGTQIVVS